MIPLWVEEAASGAGVASATLRRFAPSPAAGASSRQSRSSTFLFASVPMSNQ